MDAPLKPLLVYGQQKLLCVDNSPGTEVIGDNDTGGILSQNRVNGQAALMRQSHLFTDSICRGVVRSLDSGTAQSSVQLTNGHILILHADLTNILAISIGLLDGILAIGFLHPSQLSVILVRSTNLSTPDIDQLGISAVVIQNVNLASSVIALSLIHI